MLRLLAAVALLLPAIAVAEEDGFVPLFDGESIDGWVQRGGHAEYRVEDGAIVGRAVPKSPNSFLCTPRDYADYEMTLEFKVDPRLNSGLMIRGLSRDDYKDGRVHGYQAEIDPSPRAYTGGIYDEARRGWLQKLSDNEAARNAFQPNEWNHYRVRLVGPHIRTWINDVPAAELLDSADPKGFIGLQVHSIKGDAPEQPMEVRWRNIQLKELSPARPEPLADDAN